MNESSVVDYITNTFPGVETTTAYGYIFFFYRSERMLPFATLISSVFVNRKTYHINHEKPHTWAF